MLLCQPEIFSSLSLLNPGHVPQRPLARRHRASRALTAVFIYRPQTPSRIIYAMGWVPTNCVQYVASRPAFGSPVANRFKNLSVLFLAVQYLRLKIKSLLSIFYIYKAYLLIHRLKYVFCRVVSLRNIYRNNA